MDTKVLLCVMDDKYIAKYNLDSSYLNKKIVIYNDRYTHILKHKCEFSSTREYNNAINNISNIVSNPDFIVIDKNKNSMEFIKTLSDNILVAARLSIYGELKVKTLYPINKSKKNKLYVQRTK